MEYLAGEVIKLCKIKYQVSSLTLKFFLLSLFWVDFKWFLLIMKVLDDKGRSHYFRDVIFSLRIGGNTR